jgi:hypothetical protein
VTLKFRTIFPSELFPFERDEKGKLLWKSLSKELGQRTISTSPGRNLAAMSGAEIETPGNQWGRNVQKRTAASDIISAS